MSERRYLHRKPPEFSDQPLPPTAAYSPVAKAQTRTAVPEIQAAPDPPAPKPPEPQAPQPPPPEATPPPPKTRRERRPIPEEQDAEPTSAVHWAILGLICALALWLRLREPLSSPIMGAEDPYLHMERTWNLVQGKGVHDYPVGFMVLLAPFTLAGREAFYTFARFAPPLFGVVAVLGMFLLTRRRMEPTGALAASLFVGTMPEQIVRTNLLFPTALDLAILPFFFLAFLRAVDGRVASMISAAGLALILLLVHPWIVALLIPPLAAYALVRAWKRTQHHAVPTVAGAGAALLFVGVLILLPSSRPSSMVLDHAIPHFGTLVTDPKSIAALPDYVDYPAMLTWPILILAIIGIGVAAVRRTPLALFALAWTLLLFPLSLVDWFDIWFIPHRTVAFMSLGVAVLAALPVAELVRVVREARPNLRVGATLGAVAVLGLLLVPTAAATPPWYRIYQPQDFAAWQALDARGTPYLVTGSWESRAGYRALTTRDAVYNPQFFQDETAREWDTAQHPGLVVLIDRHTREAGLPTEFLAEWERIGVWLDVEAYAPRSAA